MIMGLWAQADAVAGDVAAFAADLEHLVSLVAESGFEFFEVYHARTGAVDGGWQVGRHWASEPHQTWSATALLGVVLGSVFGIRPTSAGLLLAPMLPDGLRPVRLSGIRYGGALLDIEVTGQGNRLVGIEVDGVGLDPGAAVHVPVTVRDESAASGSTIVIRARVA
jgi:cellobiose phosphorylase